MLLFGRANIRKVYTMNGGDWEILMKRAHIQEMVAQVDVVKRINGIVTYIRQGLEYKSWHIMLQTLTQYSWSTGDLCSLC